MKPYAKFTRGLTAAVLGLGLLGTPAMAAEHVKPNGTVVHTNPQYSHQQWRGPHEDWRAHHEEWRNHEDWRNHQDWRAHHDEDWRNHQDWRNREAWQDNDDWSSWRSHREWRPERRNACANAERLHNQARRDRATGHPDAAQDVLEQMRTAEARCRAW